MIVEVGAVDRHARVRVVRGPLPVAERAVADHQGPGLADVAFALEAGATNDEIVASLEAVTPVTGTARVVQCTPKIPPALGHDVDAALERRDP